MKPIKDHPNLARANSGAIINKDTSGLEQAKARKLAKRNEKNKLDELEKRIDGIESSNQRIESLLRDLIYRSMDDGK
jgi:hypothetical protein